MAASANAAISSGEGKTTTIVDQSRSKNGKAAATQSITGIRLFFLNCLVGHTFSAWRAYTIYQDFDSWGSLSRGNKVELAWGFIATVAMVVFTPAYVVVEYQRMKRGQLA
ncbi:hypothetical protein F5Y18DRAFT_421926 [Xylariaceae sp. FL1019]|nr:hypothetical protein F5Y18DRAFT_421926 [Xylariaceae sp. FL1019]